MEIHLACAPASTSANQPFPLNAEFLAIDWHFAMIIFDLVGEAFDMFELSAG